MATLGDSQATTKARPTPLWKINDAKANKTGQRGTIYWVGKSIMGEDGSFTGQRTSGASYDGEWHGNKKHGYGVQVFPNGEKYEGQWGHGLRNGEGTLWVPISSKTKKLRKLYVGGWRDDKWHGRGTCFFKNGEFFQGSWDEGKMNGNGTLRYSNGDLYIGNWVNGMRSGNGTLNKANGDCYEGYWLVDKREGSGSYFYADSGKVFVGEWANDMPKAGIYTQANPNPEQATIVPVTSILPPARLALSAQVLEGALATVRKARRGFRAKHTAARQLFAEDELEALQLAFDRAQADGNISMDALQLLCEELGTEVGASRLRELVGEVKGPQAESVAYEDFLRVVALLLDEEAAAGPEYSQEAVEFGDEWQSDAAGEDDSTLREEFE